MKAHAADGAPPPARSPDRLSSRRVLVVDDDEDSCEVMRIFLESLGHEVHVALEGSRALEVAAQVEVDVALLDIGLPGMNGFDLVTEMRKLPTCATIPIIAVSGYSQEADRLQAKRAGFSAHFAKPLDLRRLERILNDTVP